MHPEDDVNRQGEDDICQPTSEAQAQPPPAWGRHRLGLCLLTADRGSSSAAEAAQGGAVSAPAGECRRAFWPMKSNVFPRDTARQLPALQPPHPTCTSIII